VKRARNPRWSFVVMRGADKTVKQFHVSKRSVIAVPAVLALTVAGCIAGMQLKSASELSQLERQLSIQAERNIQAIADKDASIVELQDEITELSRKSDEMKRQMEQLGQLELKLKRFIDKYGSTNDTTTQADISSDVTQLSLHIGGTHSRTAGSHAGLVSGSNYMMAALAVEASPDMNAISDMIDTLEQSVELSLIKAQERQAAIDGYPSSWPTSSKRVSSSYGYRKDPFTGKTAFHAGIDIQGKHGDYVLSAANGTVSETGSDSSMGRYIVIDHVGDLQTIYMHLKQIDAEEGDTVVRGERIGLMGSSGRSTGPHLHFQIMQKSEAVNPLKFLALVKES